MMVPKYFPCFCAVSQLLCSLCIGLISCPNPHSILATGLQSIKKIPAYHTGWWDISKYHTLFKVWACTTEILPSPKSKQELSHSSCILQIPSCLVGGNQTTVHPSKTQDHTSEVIVTFLDKIKEYSFTTSFLHLAQRSCS